jgi:L-fucose mutarotase/ribose pyranase (RbsD/FucU family)
MNLSCVELDSYKNQAMYDMSDVERDDELDEVKRAMVKLLNLL